MEELKRILRLYRGLYKRKKDFFFILPVAIISYVVSYYLNVNFTKEVYLQFASSNSIGLIAKSLGIFLAVMMVFEIINLVLDNYTEEIWQTFYNTMTVETYDIYLKAPYEKVVSSKGQDLYTKAIGLSYSMSSTFGRAFVELKQALQAFFAVLIFMGQLTKLSWAVILIVVIYLAFKIHFKQKVLAVENIQFTKQAKVDRRQKYLKKLLSNNTYLKDISLNQIQTWIKNKTTKNYQETSKIHEPRENIEKRSNQSTGLLSVLLQLVVLLKALSMVKANVLDISELILIIGQTNVLLGQLGLLVDQVFELRTLGNEFKHYVDFLDYFKEEKGEKLELNESFDHLTLENVTYSVSEKRNILEDINLTINKGEKIALLGENGAGKSTLINVILGLIEPSKGQVLYNDKAVTDYSSESYYDKFSAVFQKVYILDYTFKDFILDGKSYNEDKYQEAVNRSGAVEIFNQFEDGDNTKLVKQIDGQAVDLSGGQMQKLIFARALYKDGEIFVLDEPTSALDPVNEKRQLESYLTELADKTIIITSHRTSVARFCDRIVYMKNGEIIELGTHDELIEKKGDYYDLYQAQAKFYEE